MVGWKVVANVGVAWDKTLATKQTLFPVWGDKEERKPRQGYPSPEAHGLWGLRATKGVNMHPYPTITLTNQDGSLYMKEDEARLSVVGIDKIVPQQGSCPCGGPPLLSESKPFQLEGRDGETHCKIRGGFIELKKLQIGCCTGARGHGSPFCIKVEFLRDNSPLKGFVCYSVPIEVGAKGPFSKAITGKRLKMDDNSTNSSNTSTTNNTSNNNNSNMILLTNAASQHANSSNNMIVPSGTISHAPPTMKIIRSPSGTSLQNYEGATEIIAILSSLNLHQYISMFVTNEIDWQAFLQLSDEDLTRMGITKMGPKVKILKHIQKLKDDFNSSSYNPINSPSDAFPPLPDVQNLPGFTSLPSDDNEQSNKRRKILLDMLSNSTISSPISTSFFMDSGGRLNTPPIPLADLPSLTGGLNNFQNNFQIPSPIVKSDSYNANNSTTIFPPPPLPSSMMNQNVNLQGMSFSSSSSNIPPISLYLYLSHVDIGKNKLKKRLFLVRSRRDKNSTEEIVQSIQKEVLKELKKKENAPKDFVYHHEDARAQMMLVLQPDKNGDWVARSHLSAQLWSFKRGDYIKIDNHHEVRVAISVSHYVINENGDYQLIEDSTGKSKKYPILNPGSSLEIGIDDNREPRSTGAMDSYPDPAEIFGVTRYGKLLATLNEDSKDTCIYSFKRRKVDMKKVESLDDFQKELFLSKCLEVDSLDNN